MACCNLQKNLAWICAALQIGAHSTRNWSSSRFSKSSCGGEQYCRYWHSDCRASIIGVQTAGLSQALGTCRASSGDALHPTCLGSAWLADHVIGFLQSELAAAAGLEHMYDRLSEQVLVGLP